MIYLIFLFALAAPQVFNAVGLAPAVYVGSVPAAPLLTVIEDDRFPADQATRFESCGEGCASLK